MAESDSASTAADSSGAVEQVDIFDVLDRILGKRVKPTDTTVFRAGLKWSLLPTFSVNPVYGTAIGALIQGSGRRGSQAARYSSIGLSGNVSTTGQVQLQLRGQVFSKDENYLVKLDCRYLDTERSTWGLGPISTQTGEFPMTFVLERIYATVLRCVSGPVFLGIGVNYDEFNDIVDELAEEGESTPFVQYSGGLVTTTRAVGMSINLLADTRDNLVDARHGYYLNSSFRNYIKTDDTSNNWQELWVEARVYPHLPKKSDNILAFWLYGWMSFGHTPYLNLPANGWDTYGRSARGYVAGRIRGTSQIYVESEYRWTLTANGLFGAVVFANGTTTTTDSGIFGELDYAVGTGLRVKLNKATSTNVTLDYGWGRADSHGFFLGMSEVF